MLSRLREEAAQGLVAYAMLILFVAIVLILVVTLFGEEVRGLYEYITTHLWW